MKKLVFHFVVFLFQLLLFGQANIAAATITRQLDKTVCVRRQDERVTDTLVLDLDHDQKADSVFYDRQSSILICKLSTQRFLAIKSDTIAMADKMSYISKTAKGFGFTNNWMREGYNCDFTYSKKLKNIRLTAMNRYAFGPANNDGSGESDLNLLTGDYEGNWNYYDERREKLVKMPLIRKKIVLPATSLQNFSDDIFYKYEKICMGYYEKAKAKMVLGSKTQTFSKSFMDVNGKNRLEIKIVNPCILDTPPWDADSCSITATLTHKKAVKRLFYNHQDAQMSLIYMAEKEVALRKVSGATAVFIPFYYCGATEDFDRKVSYFIFYKGKKYSFHLDYTCKNEHTCELDDDLDLLLKDLPVTLKSYFSKYLSQKHRLRKSFHQG